MINDAALIAELGSNRRYAAAVASGDNATLLDLLNAVDPKKPHVRHSLPLGELRQALAPWLHAISPEDVAKLQFIVGEGPLHTEDDATQQALLAWAEPYPGLPEALDALALRAVKVCEAFGVDEVRLEDLWRLLPQIPHSHHAKYLRDEFVSPKDRAANKKSGADRGKGPTTSLEEIEAARVSGGTNG